MFANRNPVVYLILFLFTVILRLPSFHPDFFGTVESSYFIAAQRLAEGGHSYQDVWELKPPLTLWFYEGWYSLLGDNILWGLKVFGILYVFLGAVLIDGLIANYRFASDASILPGFLYSTLLSIPWYHQEVSPELLLTLPTLLAFSWLIQYTIEEKHSWNLLFGIGILLGLCIGIKWQGIIVIGSIFATYVSITRPLLRDLTTMFGGLIFTLFLMILPLYYQGSLSEFWDLAVLYTYDHYRFDSFNGQLTEWFSILEVLRLFGFFVLLTVFGFLAMKSKSTSTIKLRKLETVMSIWLIAGGINIVLSGKFFYLPYLFFGIPPMIYYISGYFGGRGSSFFRSSLLLASYIFPIYTYILFIFCSNSMYYEWLKPYESKDVWIGQMRGKLSINRQEELIAQDLKRQNIQNGILVAYYQPELYLKFNQRCASKYVDFTAAYNKMDWLQHNFRHAPLFSAPEDMAKVYETFRKEQPDYIIDPYNVFGDIKAHLPILLEPYAMKKVGYYKVYYRRKER